LGKTQLTSFWDKLGWISIFCRNYFNGGLIERYTKDKIFSHENAWDSSCNDLSYILHRMTLTIRYFFWCLSHCDVSHVKSIIFQKFWFVLWFFEDRIQAPKPFEIPYFFQSHQFLPVRCFLIHIMPYFWDKSDKIFSRYLWETH